MIEDKDLLNIRGGVSLKTLTTILFNVIYIIKALRLTIKRR